MAGDKKLTIVPSPPARLPVVEGKRPKAARSAFSEGGFGPAVQAVKDEIRELYLWDKVPWVVGYSGGKDSSTVLQLVWTAIAELPPDQRQKPIHVVSTDTLVEQPVVAMWVDESHEKMRAAAREQAMPVVPHKLTPEVKDTYWVNLIGKGYFPNASHQVIILSTDTEVDRRYYDELSPCIARAYHLSYDEMEKRTVAEEGYFWTRQAQEAAT